MLLRLVAWSLIVAGGVGQFIVRVPPAVYVYVRAGASGAATGANWTDAVTAMPAILARGTTYYIADGSYAAITVDTPVAGTTAIVLKHAIAADHGTDNGWNATYGDDAATFATMLYKTKYVDTYRVTSADFINLYAGAAINPANTAFLNFYGVSAKRIFVVAQDVVFSGGSFGGFDPCTVPGSEDIVMIWDNGQTAVPPATTASSRVTFDGVVIHDSTDHGNLCAGEANPGIHADCMQLLGGHDITIKKSLFYNCPTSAILGASFRDTLDGLVLENNWFQAVQSPGATLNFGGGTIAGTFTIRYNTILGFSSFTHTGGTITLIGNILSVNACGTGSYDYTLFVGGTTCGTNTRTGTPSYTSSPTAGYLNGLIPDYHLTGSDIAAKDLGNLSDYPATDYDGALRYVGTAPDLGASEYR